MNNEDNFLKYKLKQVSKKLNKFKFKNNLVIFMVIIIVGFIATTLKIYETKTKAYCVLFGGKEIGIVREKENVNKIVEYIQKELNSTYKMNVVIQQDIKFKDTHVKDNLISSKEKLEQNIKSKLTFVVNAYSLVVDGKEVAVLKTKKEAENILKKFKELNTKIDDDSDVKQVKFLEKIEISKTKVKLSKIMNQDVALQKLIKGTDKIKTHIVEEGESYWTIAKKYKMSVDDLINANPGKDPEKVYPGDKVSLLIPEPMITVATVENQNYSKDINFGVKVEYDPSMYKNKKRVKDEGKCGKSQVLAEVTKYNGVEVDRKIIKEQILSEPVDRVLVKGTKEVPRTVATGVFALPARGSLNSGFGMRWGRMHTGIDLGGKVGDPIKAADGGKVTYTGWKGNYGYMVAINHENGFVTRYAHCSKIYVKQGQRVYKGQTIAAIGTTGRTTGPHLHFEVLKNGVYQNPSKYVNR